MGSCESWGMKAEFHPPEWTRRPLGSILTLLKDGTHGTHRRSRKGVPLLSAKNISPGGEIVWTDDDDRISQEEFESIHRTYRLEQEDVLLTVVGTLGRAAILKTGEPFTIQRSVAVLRADRSVVIPDFLFHRVRSDEFVAELHRRSNATAQSGVYLGQLEKIQILVPPLPEQRKIAAILSSIDETIECLEAEVLQLRVVASVFLRDVFDRHVVRKKDPSSGTGSHSGSVSWKLVLLDECVDAGRPICYGILMPGRGCPDGIPVVKVKNIRDGRIDTGKLLLTTPEIEEKYRRSRLTYGDVLLTIRGTTGRLAVVPPELEGANITQDTARIAVRDGVVPDYIYTVLQSPDLQRQIQEHTRGQAVKGINIGDVRRLQLPLPEYEEQKVVASSARALAECREATEANLKSLRILKRGLASRLLAGELRVTPDEAAA